MVNLTDLASVAFGGVTLHNVLQYGVKRLLTGVNKVAADVQSGNVSALEADVKTSEAFIGVHAPGVARVVEDETAKLKASAEAEIAAAQHAAAGELRKLAESLEKATGTPAPLPAPLAAPGPATPIVG